MTGSCASSSASRRWSALILCLPLHYAWKLAGRRSPWPRRFLGWVGRSAGMRTRIVGTPLTGHVLFVANHRSWLDILLLAGASGTAFVAKAEVARLAVDRLAGAAQQYRLRRPRPSGAAVRGQADALRTALADRPARSRFSRRARPTAAPRSCPSGRACSPRSSRRCPASGSSRSRSITARRPTILAWVGDESGARQCEARCCPGPGTTSGHRSASSSRSIPRRRATARRSRKPPATRSSTALLTSAARGGSPIGAR